MDNQALSGPFVACQRGCGNDRRSCPNHGPKAKHTRYNQHRPTPQRLGYGTHWRAFTRWYRAELTRHGIGPVCGAALPGAVKTTDSLCVQQGRLTYGNIVDHIRPVTGPDDPDFYNPLNLQLLCGSGHGQNCHDHKRSREARPPKAS